VRTGSLSSGGAERLADTVRRVRDLVVLAGPIGSGKSTVAELLGHRVAGAGSTAAVADLDDVAFAHRGPLDLPEFWRRAGVAHVGLVNGWFEAGVDVVIAHGPFFESGTYDALFATVQPAGRVHHILLRVTFDCALERVTTDRDRGQQAVSKDPDFLRSTHDAFAQIEPDLPPTDLVLDTSQMSASAAAARIATLVL
jgi:shikimate kinase